MDIIDIATKLELLLQKLPKHLFSKNKNILTIANPEITFQNTITNNKKGDYELFKLDSKIKAILESSGLQIPEDTIVIEPKLPGPDLTLDTKAIYEANKTYNIGQIAGRITEILHQNTIGEIECVEQQGIFVNMWLSNDYFCNVAQQVIQYNKSYGSISDFINENIIVEYSSPNIAKQMTIGHLRTTIIGQCLCNILEFSGAKIYKRNYLGDRGSAFAKFLVSLEDNYQKDGNIVFEKLKENPTQQLGKIYASFKEIATPENEQKAREYFFNLEQGDELITEIWKIIKELSIIDFNQIYKQLKIDFDCYLGESYAQQFSDEIIKDLYTHNLIEEDQGTLLIRFNKNGQISTQLDNDQEQEVFLLKKSDGSTLYSLRDIALAKLKTENHGTTKIINVVGNEQSSHFTKVINIVDELGYIKKENFIYVGFGLILQNGKKMSSRDGKVIKLGELIKEIQEKITTQVEGTDQQTAQTLAQAAIIFNDIKNDRVKDINFDEEAITRLNGDSGVYLHYTKVRINALCEKYPTFENNSYNRNEKEKNILKKISLFPKVLSTSAIFLKPHLIAQYVLDIIRDCNNRYTTSEKINTLSSDEQSKAIMLAHIINIFLENSFKILHLGHISKM